MKGWTEGTCYSCPDDKASVRVEEWVSLIESVHRDNCDQCQGFKSWCVSTFSNTGAIMIHKLLRLGVFSGNNEYFHPL